MQYINPSIISPGCRSTGADDSVSFFSLPSAVDS